MLLSLKKCRNTCGCLLNIVHDLKLTLFLSLSFLIIFSTQVNAGYPDEIEAEVIAAAQAELVRQHPGSEIEVLVNPINPSLALARCSSPLDIRFPYTSDQRLTARVNCGDAKPWSIFVTARIALWKQVVITAEPITRGTRISANQLTLGRANVTREGNELYNRIDQVTGQRAKRSIGAQQPVSARDLEPALVVNRGDQVTLEVDRGGVTIRVKAIALEDGRLGEQISVQNVQSKRDVIAEVVGTGRVKIF